MSPALRHTPLHATHVAAGARMVDFSGWEMPVHYGSQIEEHHAVRQTAGMFDVSHMLSVDVSGAGARELLRVLLANDVARLQTPGKALYACMLNETGGVIDDLIVYWFGEDRYRLVLNAGCADKDVAWIRQQVARSTGNMANVSVDSRRDLAMIAIQGPQALELACAALPELNAAAQAGQIPATFHAALFGEMLVARTGYTGEDGIEISFPARRATEVWQALAAAGVRPCGLGARDTLRLEAGLNLYGQDMDEQVSPLDAGLGWTVDLKDEARPFIGRAALERQAQQHRLLGLILDGKGVLRAHMQVFTAGGEGETTSGSFSPTLQQAIALARLPLSCAPGETVEVDIRGKRLPARTVKLPFVRQGKILV